MGNSSFLGYNTASVTEAEIEALCEPCKKIRSGVFSCFVLKMSD